MAVTEVQNSFGGTAAASHSLTITAPTAGNLLVLAQGSVPDVATALTVPAGWTSISEHPASSSGTIKIWAKVADGSEGTSIALASTGTSTYMGGHLLELSTNVGSWSVPGAFDTTVTGTTTGPAGGATTITTTLSGATTVPDAYVYSFIVVSGTSGGFLGTWTAGFTSFGLSTIGNRIAAARKTLTASETSSTTETWTTSRIPRSSMVAIKIPQSTGLAIPTATATPFSSTQINLSWTSASGATAYDIERDGTVIAYGHPLTTYSDTGLGIGTAHTYRVRSVG